MAAVLSVRMRHDEGVERPRLVLTDTSVDTAELSKRRSTRKPRSAPAENWMFATAAVGVLLFFIGSGVQSLSRQIGFPGKSTASAAISVPVTVHSGDTLWSYAQRYGAANTYILDRVDTIAAANNLSPDAVLAPGQHLRIPVTNPILLARLETSRRLASRRR